MTRLMDRQTTKDRVRLSPTVAGTEQESAWQYRQVSTLDWVWFDHQDVAVVGDGQGQAAVEGDDEDEDHVAGHAQRVVLQNPPRVIINFN